MLYVNPLEWNSPVRTAEGPNAAAREKMALRELEHHFLYMLMREMRKTVDIAGQSAKSRDKEVYEEMMDDALSDVMARSGQLGVAKQLEQQLHQVTRQTVAGTDKTMKEAPLNLFLKDT